MTSAAAAASDATETYRHARSTATHTATAMSVGTGARARNTPHPVATPLPPAFHARYGVRTCPAIATSPYTSAQYAKLPGTVHRAK